MKKAIVTTIMNDYDWLYPIDVDTKGWDLFCITDNPEPYDYSKIKGAEIVERYKRAFNQWTMIQVPAEADPRRAARRNWIKFWEYIPEGYDIVMTMGGQIKVIGSINSFFEEMYDGADITCGRHMARKCAYREAATCIERGKDDAGIITAQMEHYRREGYPEDNGLVETGVMIRKNNAQVRKFSSKWYNEIEKWSLRDQLSFNYTLWKNPIVSVDYYPKKIYLPRYKMFKIKSHRKK